MTNAIANGLAIQKGMPTIQNAVLRRFTAVAIGYQVNALERTDTVKMGFTVSNMQNAKGINNMAYLNKVMLIGRLTDNPDEPKTLPNSGSTLVRFRFAVGKSKKDKQTGQWVNDPNPLYIDCEAYSKPEYSGLTDVIARYCQRGTELLIEGKLQFDMWDDKNNPGQKRSKHKLIVESVQFVGGKQESQQQSAYGGGGGNWPPQDNSLDGDEPPF